MRVTQGMLTDRLLTSLASGAERMLRAQNVASSGKRIERPSDDVASSGRIIGLRSAIAGMDQFLRNAEMSASKLSAAHAALDSAVSALQTARTLGVTAANSALTDEARSSIASQLNYICSELQGIANTQYLGNYLFAGSKTNTQPIILNPGGQPPCLYQGDSVQVSNQIAPGVLVETNVTADVVFNVNGAANPECPDAFAAIQTLRSLTENGNAAAISDQIRVIDDVLNNVVSVRSQIGARMARIERVRASVIDSQILAKDLLSKTEDADLAEAIIELQTRQNVYQAATLIAQKIMEMSLTRIWQ